MIDKYNLGKGEIFQKSKCIEQEQVVVKQIEEFLLDKGYQVDGSGQVWHKNDRKIVVSFVDDFSRHSAEKKYQLGYCKEIWFDRDTTVITDNHILFNPEYNFIKAPDSYFGIYSYDPDPLLWAPERDFHFPVNRIDKNRLTMFLELLKFYGPEDLLSRAYINFNSYDPSSFNHSDNDAKNNFQWTYQRHQSDLALGNYDADFLLQVKSMMPVKNHSYSFEQVDHMTWVNVVMETYIDDNVIALSEKIFRALSTPVPWICLCSRGSINFLESLGFDTMNDIVDHGYNNLLVDRPAIQTTGRFRKLIEHIDSTVASLKKRPFKSLQTRAKKAADNNVKLLAKMKKSFYSELDSWLQQVSKIC